MKSPENFEPELTPLTKIEPGLKQVEPELTKDEPDVKVELETEVRQMPEDNLRVV